MMIWDGVKFRHVSKEEAEKLASEDKAQVLSKGFVSGGELKRRKDFSGYNKPDAVQVKTDAVQVKTDAVQTEPLKDWRSYRTVVAKELDKPASRVKKAEVEKWLESQNV